jgi:hypothetical protein
MRSWSPSTWKIVASKASHRRAALLNTAANTGWTSVGELEMTRRISAVAVCCSSDSVSARLRLSTSLFGSAYDRSVGLAPSFYPTVSCLRHSATTGETTVSMEAFIFRAASPPQTAKTP